LLSNNRLTYKFINGRVENSIIFSQTVRPSLITSLEKSNRPNIKLHAATNIA